MLRKFLYLDEAALNGYVSSLEDGLRSSRRTESQDETSRQGRVNLRVADGQRGSGSTSSDSVDTLDTAEARFDRFLRLAQADEESSGWLDITILDDLNEAGTGAVVDFECEIHVPAISQMGGSEMSQFASMASTISDLAPLFGESTEGLPSRDELQAVSKFSSMMSGSNLIIVGEDDESELKIAGSLSREIVGTSEADLSDYVRVCGKVKKRIPRGEFKSLLGLPGMSLLPREERRALEKKGPESKDDEDMFLRGPARMIDVLAIYV